MHLHIEPLWAYTADYNLDIVPQDQLSLYSARGILVKSFGPTSLYDFPAIPLEDRSDELDDFAPLTWSIQRPKEHWAFLFLAVNPSL